MTKLATPAEVAKHLGVTPEALRQWAHRGTGPRYVKVGSARRYRWTDVENYLDQNTTHPGGDAPQLDCSICKKPVRSDGYIAVSRQEVARARRELETWKERGDHPEAARWFIAHRACDPNPEQIDYWYDVERVNTYPKFLGFLAHVTEKSWVRDHTDLPTLIRRAIGE